jgi:hypothetical protein
LYCSIVMPVKLLRNCNLCGSSALNIVSPLTSWKLLSVRLDQLKATISCPRQNFYFKELKAVATHVCHVEIFFYSIEILIFGQYSGSNYFLKHNWKSFMFVKMTPRSNYILWIFVIKFHISWQYDVHIDIINWKIKNIILSEQYQNLIENRWKSQNR